MDLDALLLSRIQFAFVVSFHIIFPAFTIGLAAWLATIEGMRLATGNPIYRRVFDFWLKVFAPPPRRLAVRLDRRVLCGGFALSRGDVLALHDPIRDHCRQRCSARKIAVLPVLGRRRVRIAGDCGLHRGRLLVVPRQAPQGIRMSGGRYESRP
jgi:hypothetical protein